MQHRTVRLVASLFILAACSSDGGSGPVDPPGGNGGTIQGTVTGPGGPVPGAQVALAGSGQVETDSDGEYRFTKVAAGQKSLTISPPTGFQLAGGEQAGKSANLAEGATATVNWSVVLQDTNPKAAAVALNASSFSPPDLVVPVGSTVTWTNQNAIAHTITPDNAAQAGAWSDVTLSAAAATFQHTFANAGTFEYDCRFHSGMTGVVRVH